MSWSADIDGKVTAAILSDTPLGFLRPDMPQGELVGFYLRDPKTIEAIRNRDTALLDLMNFALDEIDDLAVVHDLDGKRDDWTTLSLDEQEVKFHQLLMSRYANDDDRARAILNLERIADERRLRAEEAEHRNSTRVRRAQFGNKRDRLMLAIIKRDGYCCAECGSTEDITVDHIVPLSREGSDELNNLRLLCRSCNSRKGNRL